LRRYPKGQDTRCKKQTGWNLFVIVIFPFFGQALAMSLYLCRYLDNKARSVWKPCGALLNGRWRQSARKNCAISPFLPTRNLFLQLSSGIGSTRGDGTRKTEREGKRKGGEREGGREREKESVSRMSMIRFVKHAVHCLAMSLRFSINTN